MISQKSESKFCLCVVLALLTLLVTAGDRSAYAIPAYARRLGGISCTTCHQPVYPRLTRTAWNFRRLGYRMPSEMGKSLVPGMTATVVGPPVEPSGAGLDTAKVARGRQVYASSNCASCHTIGGAGGSIGPDLSNEGNMHDRAWLTNFMPHPGGIMPPFQGSQADLDALVEYMLALKPASGQAPAAACAPEQKIIHYNYADTISALFVARYDNINRSDAHTFSQFYVNEVGGFFSGPVLSNWGYFIHFTMLDHEPEFNPDTDHFEISPSEFSVESAELRYEVGKPNHYFGAKLGQFEFSGIDGFMGNNGQVTTDLPLMFTTTVNEFAQEVNQQGIDVGYTFPDDHISLLMLNGVNAEGEGDVGRPINRPDWEVQWLHWLGRCGSSVQVIYYNGRTPLDETGDVVDNFFRLYLLGNWRQPIGKCNALNLLGGYMTGDQTKAFAGPPLTLGSKFDVHSFFVEADYEMNNRLVPYLRYDAFHTDESDFADIFNDNPPRNTTAWTIGAAYQPDQAFRFNLEVVPLSENPDPDQTTLRAQIWFMW